MPNYKNPLAAKKDKPKIKTYNFTAEQLRATEEKAYRAGQAAAVPVVNAMYSAAMLLALNSKLGYGKVRMGRIFTEVQKYFEELRDGEISYADVTEELREHGVNLHVETIDGKEESAVEMFQKLNLPKLKVKWRGKV